MKKAAYYRYGQALPPRHWYQRSVGWFGKALTVVMILSLTGSGAYGYILTRASVKSLTAETTNPDRLKKVTDTMPVSSVENIVDAQFVLDEWAKQHAGESWSVSIKSIEGPHFSAQLNQDKQFTSKSLQKLLVAVPLYQQVPIEHQKGIQLTVGGVKRSMQTCVDLMIRLSDQSCADTVVAYLNFKTAGDALKKLGLPRTSFEGHQSVRTTTADVSNYLVALQNNTLPRTAQDSVLRLLREQHYRTGIPSGCPGCQIANKSFPNDDISHDAAIVRYTGGSYVLVITTTNGDSADIGILAGKIQQKIIDTML